MKLLIFFWLVVDDATDFFIRKIPVSSRSQFAVLQGLAGVVADYKHVLPRKTLQITGVCGVYFHFLGEGEGCRFWWGQIKTH